MPVRGECSGRGYGSPNCLLGQYSHVRRLRRRHGRRSNAPARCGAVFRSSSLSPCTRCQNRRRIARVSPGTEPSRGTSALHAGVMIGGHMPSSLIVLLLLASVSFAPSGPQHSDERLPQLNVIRTATLSPSYSCHGSYRGSALFFTKYGSQYGTPEDRKSVV